MGRLGPQRYPREEVTGMEWVDTRVEWKENTRRIMNIWARRVE